MTFHRNLLIVLAHGLRSDAVASYGHDSYWPLSTPNLTQLADRSLRLVATSACPSDWGGQLSLLTGLHARQHGQLAQMRKPAACFGWPQLLQSQGYHVAGVGCVNAIAQHLHEQILVEPPHVGDSPTCRYLQHAAGRGLKPAIIAQRKQRERFGPFEPDRLALEPDDDIDGFIAQRAAHMLDTMPTDKPWALIVMFTGPGNELPPPRMYDDVVQPVDLRQDFVPANFKAINDLAELDYPRVMLQRLDAHSIGRVRADYLGRVALLDFAAGRLASHLAQRKDSHRNWMVFSSDRGQLLGEHGLVGHRSFLAPAVEVPVLITPPRKPRHDVTDWLCSTVDVAATIAHLGGCDLPPWVTGRNLLPALMGQPIAATQGKTTHTGALSEFGQRLMLETERYKIIFDTENHRLLGLYDMLNDGEEKTNLVDKPAGRNLVDAMRWRVGDALLPLRAVPHSAAG